MSTLNTSMIGSPWRFGPALQYDLEIGADGETPAWFHMGSGVRGMGPAGGATVPLETYLQARLVGAAGPWRPAVGPELGLTGLFRPETRLRDSFVLAEGNDERDGYLEQRDDPGPLYLAFTASLLRFAIDSFRLSAADLHLGTSLIQPGSAFRFQLDAVRVGWMP